MSLFGPRKSRKIAKTLGGFRKTLAWSHGTFFLEPLEQRHMLSVTVNPITGPEQAGIFGTPAGKDLYVPVIGSDAGQTITYTATSSDPNIHVSVLTGNPTLQLTVHGVTANNVAFSGTMTFQLFEDIAPQTVQGIINQVNAGLYNGASFYRSETNASFQLIQGGIEKTPGKTDNTILPDEFNPAASFNSSGLLAMANAGPGTATSEFFITAPNRTLANDPQSLNFGYTIFGQLLTGLDIYNDILNTPTTTSGGISMANQPVTIDSASIITDTQNAVLRISESSSTAVGALITVTGHGSDGTSAQQTFSVAAAPPTLGADGSPPLFLSPIANQTTPQGTPVSFQITANEQSAGTLAFSVSGGTTFTGSPPNVTVQVTQTGSNTATVTLTPNAGFSGTISLVAHADDSSNALHDALPFTLSVTSNVAVNALTTSINAANQTNTSASGTGDAGATISVVASDGTNSTAPTVATVDSAGHWAVTGINVSALANTTITYTATETAGGTGSASATATKDTQAPTVSSIVTASANPTTATSVTFTVTFSENVTGVTASDFALAASSGLLGASITSVTGSGTTYTVTVNPGNGVGTLGLNLVDDDSITDATGNPLGGTGAANGNFTGQTYSVNRPPTATTIAATGTNPTNAASVTYTVTFSTSVTGVDSSDFSLVPTGSITGASITGVTGSGTTYTVTVNPGTGEGTLGLNLIDNDSITDAAGNALGGTGTGNGNLIGQLFTIDRTAPTVLSIVPANPNPTTATSVTYTVTFSESVTGVTASDFALVPSSGLLGASITSVTGSGSTYTVTVNTGNGVGTLGLNLVDDDSITDLAGNPLGGTGTANGNFTGQTYTVNRPPTVSSIAVVGANPTNAASVSFTVTFSTSVTGVTANDFTLASTGSISGASITGVTGSGTTYTVTVNTGTGVGTLGVNLVDDDSITDGAGNALGGTGTANGNFTGQTVTLDKTSPTVTSIATADANPSTATTVHFTVTFSEAVTGVTAGDFALAASSGLSGSSISGVTGSGTTYTVTVNVGSGSGTLGLNLVDDDSIVDSAGNPLGGTGTGNGNFTGQSYTISQPQNGSLAGLVYVDMNGNGTQDSGEFGLAGVILTLTGVDSQNNGIASRTTTTASDGSYQFTGLPVGTYTITEAQPKKVADGASVAGTLGGSASQDAISGISLAANGTGTGYTFSEGKLPTAQISINLFLASTPPIDQYFGQLASAGILAPIVTSITKASADPTSAATVNYTVNFYENVTGVDVGDFSLVTSSGVTGASIASVTGSGSVYTVTVNTGSGNGTLALSVVDNDSIVDATAAALGGAGAGNGNFLGPAYTISIGQIVNHAPSGTDATITTNEDTAHVFTAADFGFSDASDSPANNLSAVKVTTLPASGSLTDNGVAVTAGQFIAVADITSGLFKYTPAANVNGTSAATFTFQVQDDGGTANGGVNLDPTANTITFNVTAVNDAPAGTSKTVTTNENSAYTFTSTDFGFTDASDSPANNLLAVKITTLPASGSLTDNGVAVTAGQFVAVADITGGLLKFTPATGAAGSPLTSFTFQVEDDGGTANGGVNLDPTPETMTINVTGINTAPSGTSKTITTLENAAYTFLTSDFGFSDASDNPANNLLAVKITTIPAAGSLTDNGVAVTAGQFIAVADITGGLLKFTPATNANGTGYASFTFQVEDDGGTANGGVNLDPTPKTMTVNVTAVATAPQGASNTITMAKDSVGTFGASDFGFSDPNDSPANTLAAVKITTLPTAGTLLDNGVAVTAGQFISLADLTGGLLTFTPASGATGSPYATFTFQVQDNGSTANGGVNIDPTPRTMTLNVVVPNNPPTGTDKIITATENAALTFATTDFGFSDPDNSPANNFLAVEITTLPAAGSLTNNGVAVTAGQFVSVADITAGHLKFTPAANANGAEYASFTFQVQDDGGNVGLDTDPSPKTMTINVTAANSAPAGAANTITMPQDGVGTFAPEDFGFSDTNDTPANNLLAVKVASLPTAGTLTDNGVAVTAGQFISLADLTAGLLVFTPASGATGSPYASFTFQVQDDGGTANGGVDLDPTPNTITVNVVVPNNPPTGTSNTLTAIENSALTFAAGDFGFSDPDNTPPNNLLAVEITTLPTAGSLADNGVAVTAGQFIPLADITAGHLKFTPAPNANGAAYSSFTFQVQDDGGNIGLDTDPTPKTMTINVTAVNSAPSGADNSITLPQDTFGAFDTSDFGFSDPSDTPANSLLAVKITTLPTAGSLTNHDLAVTAGQFISAADISGGFLQFTPDAGAAGAPYATFTFQVQDDGGTANGGVDLDPTANTMSINVLIPNNPPTGTDNTVSTLENSAVTFTTTAFGYSDPGNSPPNNFLAVKIATLPAAGSLTDNGVAVTAGQFVAVTDITAGLFKFTPAANANGTGYATFTFQVQDDGGTFGIDTDPTPKTMTIDVTPVNSAPAGADNAITMFSDSVGTFDASDFGFSDPSDSPANSLLAVKITTLPAAGTLADNGVAVTAGQFIPLADLTGGLLTFTPASGAAGSPYASFTFQVQDNGGTTNGGVDLDPTANTMTINVVVPNSPPSGADKTIAFVKNTVYTLAVADFGFSDAGDVPPDNFVAVQITTLPTAGGLSDNGVAVTAGQFIPVSDISGGLLHFTPATDATGSPYATFTFQVQDDGTIPILDLDPTPKTMTFNVFALNHAPSGSDNHVSGLENTPVTIAASDFGFSDPSDTPANSLLAVKISTLPAAGSLADNGVAVTAGQFIPVADIAAGLLKFTPATNANGVGYANFTFQVQDNGGTAVGGVDLDPTPNTLTIDIASVNNAPLGANNTITMAENDLHIFGTGEFGFSDPNDPVANSLLAVKITSVPTAGSLTDNGVAVSAGQFIPVADISGGHLEFAPAGGATGTPYASFTFQVQDNGGTANGGVDLDPTPKTFTFNVFVPNSPPNGADGTVQTLENTAYTFLAADFGFSDASDTPANNLLAVKITTLPTAGTLADNGVAVTAGQFIAAADISGGLLKFTPAANANGVGYASFTFQVQDDGGVLNGGSNLDPTPNLLTIDVASVNAAPIGTDNTITMFRNSVGTFDPGDFGFSDPNDSVANALLAVKITTLPTAGTLSDNGVAVTAGQFVSVSDIASGLLFYSPATDATGSPYASFTFQVQDDGGTANGGVDLDTTPRTFTINVIVPNNPPVGTDGVVATDENTTYVFTASNFGFTDPADVPPNNFVAVKITTLPSVGNLFLVGSAPITAGQFISIADINADNLRFTPANNATGSPYTTFTFQVQDDGSIAPLTLDQTPRTMTINVTAVSAIPAAQLVDQALAGEDDWT